MEPPFFVPHLGVSSDPGRSISVGMSEFIPGEDSAVLDVFVSVRHIMVLS